MADPGASLHACAIVLDDRGLLVLGPSGSGKSRLCHGLVDRWKQMNRHARWVADDRVLLQRAGSALLARAPEPIAGLAERRFHGIEQVQWQARAVVDLVVQLVDEAALDRMPADDQNWAAPDGGHCPLILVPRGAVELSIELVEARLRQNNASETPQPT